MMISGSDRMKLIAMVDSKEMMASLSQADAYLVGIAGFSTNFSGYVTLAELEEIISSGLVDGKELFVSLNKNMHDADLEPLKTLLSSLNKLPIAGIFYYDVALVQLKQRGLCKHNLIWHQEHMTTNYDTCRFWQNHGVLGACLSSEITLAEIEAIRNQVTMPLIVLVFGYIPMFVSKRHLVTNYQKTFSFPVDKTRYTLKKEGQTYPIVNDQLGTQVYSAHILNGLSEKLVLEQAGIDYGLCNFAFLPSETWGPILDKFREVNQANVTTLESEVDLLCEHNTDKGFFYKETIFRVKKYEK